MIPLYINDDISGYTTYKVDKNVEEEEVPMYYSTFDDLGNIVNEYINNPFDHEAVKEKFKQEAKNYARKCQQRKGYFEVRRPKASGEIDNSPEARHLRRPPWAKFPETVPYTDA